MKTVIEPRQASVSHIVTVTNAAAALFLVGTTLSLVLAEKAWLADLASFFRPHLFALGVIIFGFCLAARSRLSLILGNAGVALAALPLLAALPAAPQRDGDEIRFLTANLFIQNTEFARLQNFIGEARPDFVLTQETQRLWQVGFSKVSELPYQSSRDLKSRNDMKLFSRYPIISERVIVGGKDYESLLRHPVRFEVALPTRKLIIYAIHPDTPRLASKWRQRNMYLDLLTETLQTEPRGTAVIVAGDWYTPTWSPFFRDVLSKAALFTTEDWWWPRPTRFALRFGGITWLGTPIDHIAVSSSIGLISLETGPKFGSNHLPVIARLTVRPNPKSYLTELAARSEAASLPRL